MNRVYESGGCVGHSLTTVFSIAPYQLNRYQWWRAYESAGLNDLYPNLNFCITYSLFQIGIISSDGRNVDKNLRSDIS